MKNNPYSQLVAFGGFLLLSSQIGFAQINSPTGATRPFNSNTSYQYGIMPTNLPATGTFGKSTDAGTAYAEWKTRFVRDCSGGSKRVLFDDNSSTVSEGIAYGMLLSAYAADKAVFDGLWKFYKDNSNGNGVMNWRLSECTGTTGQNGATDAELDAAMALLVAEEQWPSINSPYDYKNEATTLIGKIRQYEIHPSSYQTINGDAWGFNNNCRNPSYFSPAYYREYAKAETSQSTFWTNTVNVSNTFLLSNRNSTTGLVSNWADQNAAPNGCNGPTEYGWDACRNPWRMANDVLWNGSAAATTASDICNKMAAWSSGYHNNLKGPLPQNASNPSVGQYKNGTFSTYALAIMGTSANHQQHLNNSYTAVVGLGNSEAYFSATLRAVSLFMLTGNFWKPGSISNPPTTNQNPIVSLSSPSNSTSVCVGTATTLTATASDPDGTIIKVEFYNGTTLLGTVTNSPYTYSWTPATSGTVSITAKAYDNAATAGTATSTAASLIINNAPTVAANASKTSLCAGETLTLTGGGAITYTWSNNVTNGVAFTPASNGGYTVTGTDANGCKNTSIITIAVNNLPSITITATQASVCEGGTVTLTGNGASSYVWDNNINNGVAFSPIETKTYTVTGTANNGCKNNVSVTVPVNATTKISKQPKDTTLCEGSPLNLVVSATGTGTLTYQWKQNGNNVGGNSRIFTKPSATVTDAGNYTVDVKSNCGTVISSFAIVTVNTKPVITTQPINMGGCAGSSIALSVTATGNPTPTFAWTPTGSGTGGATSTLTFANLTVSDAGTYSVKMTNSCGTVTSNSIAISVSANTNPAVSLIADKMQVCGNQNSFIVFTANGVNTGNTPQYTFKSGTNIISSSNQNFFTYIIPTNTGTSVQNLNFTVELNSSATCITPGTSKNVTSAPVSIQVDPQISTSIANIRESKTTICIPTRTLTAVTLPPNYLATWSTVGGGASVSAGQLSGIGIGQSTLTTYTVVSPLQLCPSKTDTVTTKRISQPSKPDIINSLGPCVTKNTGIVFSVTNNPNSTYNWTVTGGIITIGQGSNNVLVDFNSGITNATISVVETNAFGCASAKSTLNLVIDICTGFDENSLISSDMKIYPNPFESNFTINLEKYNSLIDRIELCNLEGKIMETKQGSEIVSDMQLGNDVQSGQYFVRIITANKVLIKSVIKIK